MKKQNNTALSPVVVHAKVSFKSHKTDEVTQEEVYVQFTNIEVYNRHKNDNFKYAISNIFDYGKYPVENSWITLSLYKSLKAFDENCKDAPMSRKHYIDNTHYEPKIN